MYKSRTILTPLIFFCFLSGQSQTKSSPLIIYSDKAKNFYIEVFQENDLPAGNCSKPVLYKVRSRGICPGNLVLDWNFTYYDCKVKEQKSGMKVNIWNGQSNYSFSKSFTIQKIKTLIDGPASPKFVNPPSDFTITGEEMILEGTSTQLSVDAGKYSGAIKWLWFGPGSNKSFAEGATITVTPETTTEYFVRADQEGFLSKAKNFKVFVKLKPEPPKFRIAGQTKILEGDETILNIETDSSDEGVTWMWFRESDGKLFKTGKKINVNPTGTMRYSVRGELNGKFSPFKFIVVNVQPVPEPPSDFSIQGPKTIKEGETATLKITSNAKPEGVRWLWYRENETENFQEGETIVVSPGETTKYMARAVIHKKKSIPKNFTVNVVLKSIAPNILGNMKICTGSNFKEKYSVAGGRLGTGSGNWQWFEGKCGSGKLISTGKEIDLSPPSKTTTYYVRPDKDSLTCKEFTIEVFEPTVAPEKIVVAENICHDRPFTLEIQGGKLRNNSVWTWYSQPQGSTKEIKIGEGHSIVTTANISTMYAVRSEKGTCDPSKTVSLLVNVIPLPLNNGSITTKRVNRKNYNLQAAGAPSGTQFNTVWYSEICDGKKIGTGNSIDFRVKRKGSKVSMRYEGICDTLKCSTVSLTRQKRIKENFFFINTGIVSDRFSDISNGMFTIGLRSVYLRVKFNFKELQTLLDDTKVSITPQYDYTNSTILNYPANDNTYYRFNNDIERIRYSYTLGFMAGGNKARFYLGAGYGERQLLRGVDIYQRNTNTFIDSRWANNVNESLSGIEGEIGLFLKFGSFNFMGGTSIIYSPSGKQKYLDAHAGIGISF